MNAFSWCAQGSLKNSLEALNMSRKVVLILSLVSVVGLGWIMFRSPAPTPTLIDVAFIASLGVFLGTVIAECRGAIARSTQGGRGRTGSPHDPFVRDRSRSDAAASPHDTDRAMRSHGADRSEYGSSGGLTG